MVIYDYSWSNFNVMSCKLAKYLSILLYRSTTSVLLLIHTYAYFVHTGNSMICSRAAIYELLKLPFTLEWIISTEEVPEDFVRVPVECVPLCPGSTLTTASWNSILQPFLTKLVIHCSFPGWRKIETTHLKHFTSTFWEW